MEFHDHRAELPETPCSRYGCAWPSTRGNGWRNPAHQNQAKGYVNTVLSGGAQAQLYRQILSAIIAELEARLGVPKHAPESHKKGLIAGRVLLN
jgi:hypothetical protein